jgi:LPXTG-site transpeptidase (sortase) family protein
MSKSTIPKIILVGSAALLVVTGIGWQSQASVPPRSDLIGAPVTRSTAPASIVSASGSVSDVEANKSAIDLKKLLDSSFADDPDAKQNASAGNQRPLLGEPSASDEPAAGVPSAAEKRARHAPSRIVIPSLAIDAPVISVGLKDDGSMEIPGAAEAGWFKLGAWPGDEVGSAVLAGHVDHAHKPGVFIELRRLEVGSIIVLADETGRELRYTVSERFQVDKDELPTAELFRRNGPAILTLITCGGIFDRKHHSYRDNIVIRATPNFSSVVQN